MALQLHATYSKDAAIAGFAGEAQLWCDNQFAVLTDAVLGFITLGKSTDESCSPTPSTVIWKPARLDYAPSEEFPWLPKDIREVVDRSSGKAIRSRRHFIFVRPRSADEFFYAGEAHLGSYGDPAGNPDARFTLNEKLPRSVWLECGGYDGWHIEMNHNDYFVQPNDLNTFDKLLTQLTKRDYSHLCMTRYDEDSLTIHTNPKCAWLMYLREPADCGLYLNDPLLGTVEEHFQCVCGISLDFPANQTVSHSKAAKIARHYFNKGNLPDDVVWNEA